MKRDPSVIGGWDAARIVTGKFGGPLGVYNDKMGLTDNQPTDIMLWGTRLEDAIRSEFERRHGVEVKKPDKVQHSEISWLGGHPDGILEGEDVGLEVKTSSAWMKDKWGEEYTDEIPEQVIVQCQWYMKALGFPTWWVAALIGGNDYKEYMLGEDKELQGLCIEKCDKFRKDHLIPRCPPIMDDSEAAAEFLRKAFPEQKYNLREPTEGELAVIQELLVKRDALKVAKEAEAVLKATVKHLIGDHEGFQLDHGKITWKKIKDNKKVNWQALAKEMGPTPELIRKHTHLTKGVRRLSFYLKDN